jgi:hypothetical protein
VLADRDRRIQTAVKLFALLPRPYADMRTAAIVVMLPGMSIFVRTLLALLLLVHHAQASTAGGCPSQGVAAARCIALDGGGWSLRASNGAALPNVTVPTDVHGGEKQIGGSGGPLEPPGPFS